MEQDKSITKQRAEQIAKQSNAALDDSIESLSPSVEARLQQSRRIAIHSLMNQQQSAQSSQFNLWPLLNVKVLSAGLACCLMVFFTLSLTTNQHAPNSSTFLSSNTDLSEFILLSNFDDTELEVIEDIEFAYWLSQELDQPNELHNG